MTRTSFNKRNASLPFLSFGVAAAERLSRLDEELLALQVLFAQCAVEALAVVVVVEGLHPSVAGLDREAAGDALGREQLVPILFAVRQPVLEVEGRVGEDLAAVGAHEALGVERAVHRLQAVLSSPAAEAAARPIRSGRPISVTQLVRRSPNFVKISLFSRDRFDSSSLSPNVVSNPPHFGGAGGTRIKGNIRSGSKTIR